MCAWQVLLHDPLYSWSLSPAQLCALEARRAEVSGCLVFPRGDGGESSTLANINTTITAAAASGSIVNPYGTVSRRPRGESRSRFALLFDSSALVGLGTKAVEGFQTVPN